LSPLTKKPNPGRKEPPSPYMMLYPMSIYIMQAIEYKAIFLVKISTVFIDRTIPASNMEKPAAIHITSIPDIRKYNVSRA
jgi:hypothetical protein